MAFFYRFRPIRALLGTFQELERQEIYFSAPAELNDPMEGFKDLYWQGDQIVWNNLLKHYLLCLMMAYLATLREVKDYEKAGYDRNIFFSVGRLPTWEAKNTHRRICERFFANERIRRLTEALAGRSYKIRRDELYFYLRGIHGAALTCVAAILAEYGFLPPSVTAGLDQAAIDAGLDRIIQAAKATGFAAPDKEEEGFRRFYQSMSHTSDQLDFIAYTHLTDEHGPARFAIAHAFPDRYSKALQLLIYQEWYTACFVADPDDMVMWSIYGDGHKGACLKFRAAEKNGNPPTLTLHSNGSDWQGALPLDFREVAYINQIPEVDFFRSIGAFPIPILKQDWYMDDGGNISAVARDVLSMSDDWKSQYHGSFQAHMATKLGHWRHEKEYRLALTSPVASFFIKEDRKLTYKFADLEGIIFGINTPIEHKSAIATIIEKKCREAGRTAFEFSQAVYSPADGKIITDKSDFLKFS